MRRMNFFSISNLEHQNVLIKEEFLPVLWKEGTVSTLVVKDNTNMLVTKGKFSGIPNKNITLSLYAATLNVLGIEEEFLLFSTSLPQAYKDFKEWCIFEPLNIKPVK
ncbi:hypothetical protein ABER75_11850 [Niallia taxi]|uniref:hypothetical protein n=1 Tax=Niallia taxi TaxID=2499688 RepID=UPI003D2A3136